MTKRTFAHLAITLGLGLGSSFLVRAAQAAGPTGSANVTGTGTGTADSSAKLHFKEAIALFQKGEIDHACTLFEKSYAEAAEPGTLYNMARCHEAQKRYADAYRDFDELATRAENVPDQKEKATTIRASANELIPKLARIDLVHRADALSDVIGLTVDGAVQAADAWKKPVYVMPGTHVIAAQHADSTTIQRTSRALAAGEAQTLELDDPPPLPPSPIGPLAAAPIATRPIEHVSRGKRTAAYVVGGAGVALVGAGAVLGVLTLGKKSDAKSACNGNLSNCTGGASAAASAESDLSSARRLSTFSTIGVIGGVAALAAGTYLFFSARETEQPRASLRVAPYGDGSGGGLLVHGNF